MYERAQSAEPAPSRRHPSIAHASFAESLARFERFRAGEGDQIVPKCRSRLLHHGGPADRTFLLLHGFTNCPAQLELLADSLFGQGASVFVPLAEGHGRADRSPEKLSALTAHGLACWTEETVAIAAGLGRQLDVVGFSFGGVCAAWAARNADEVDRLTAIAPAFLPFGVPERMQMHVAPYLLSTPESYPWWDPVRRGRAFFGEHGYSRLSRHGIGAVFELGDLTLREPARRTTLMRRARLVLNGGDRAVSAPAARRAFEESLAPLALESDVVQIPAERGLPHDFLDPYGPASDKAGAALPMLLGLVE